jgi:hypothetical protein
MGGSVLGVFAGGGELLDGELECAGDLLDGGPPRICRAAFDATERRCRDPGFIGECFLCSSSSLAQAAYRGRKGLVSLGRLGHAGTCGP